MTEELPPTWSRVDLSAVLAGDMNPARPTLMPRTDGVCLLYPGLVHSFHGESESGKSFVVQAESARLIQAGRPVLYVDFESDAQAIVARLLLLGCTPDQIAAHLDYRRPETRPDIDLAGWADMMSRQYALAVIDGVTDALCLFGRESNGNDDIAAWHRMFPRQLARATGAAVVLIDHVTKSSDGRGRFAIGGQAKLASLDGAAYTVDVVDPLGAGLKGRLRLRVAKDRPGQVRQHGGQAGADRTQHVADFVLDATGDRLTATVYPATDGPDPAERKLAYQAVVAVRVVTQNPGMSSAKLLAAIRAEGCKVRNDHVPAIVAYAVDKGMMRTEQNGQSTRHYPAQTEPLPTSPDLSPGEVTEPLPLSPPLGGERGEVTHGGVDRSQGLGRGRQACRQCGTPLNDLRAEYFDDCPDCHKRKALGA